MSWITSLFEVTEGQIIPTDGKTLRRSYDAADSKAAVRMVGAWAQVNHLSLGSVAVDEKSNEITAIPRLLELIDVSGALVSIDAMGCQKEIAEKIVQEGDHYVLQVKDNQPNLREAIEAFFTQHLENDFAEVSCRRHRTKETSHGRREERFYFLAKVPADFPGRDEWPHLKALAWRSASSNGMAGSAPRCGTPF